MLRAALWVLALAGCDVIFRVDRVSGSATDASPSDGIADAVSADAVAVCTQPFLDDHFADGEPCKPWGNTREEYGGTVTESQGALIVQPAPNMVGSRGGCNPAGMVPWSGGVIVEVSEAIMGTSGEFTLLASPSMQIAVAVGNNQLVFQNDIGTQVYGTAVLYSPSAMRFWRIRPSDPTTIVGEYSPDARSWTQLGSLAAPTGVPQTASFGVLAGLNSNQPAQSAPDRAVYERLVVCP